jgi:hypothetical protein
MASEVGIEYKVRWLTILVASASFKIDRQRVMALFASAFCSRNSSLVACRFVLLQCCTSLPYLSRIVKSPLTEIGLSLPFDEHLATHNRKETL